MEEETRLPERNGFQEYAVVSMHKPTVAWVHQHEHTQTQSLTHAFTLTHTHILTRTYTHTHTMNNLHLKKENP